MQWLKAQAFGRGGKHFWHEEFGYNFRMSGMQAALGLEQIKRLDQYVAKRRTNADIYHKELEGTGVMFPVEHNGCRNVYWMYTVILPEGINREKIMALMAENGVETRPTFTPLHLQPIYIPLNHRAGDFPVSEFIGRQGINLPSSSLLTEEDIVYVCDSLKRALEECS
jgi:perosamine synthetase